MLGSMTLRMSRTSCAREAPTWPCLMMKDFGAAPEPAEGGAAPGPLRCVRFLRRFAMKICVTRSQRLLPRWAGVLVPGRSQSLLNCSRDNANQELHKLTASDSPQKKHTRRCHYFAGKSEWERRRNPRVCHMVQRTPCEMALLRSRAMAKGLTQPS